METYFQLLQLGCFNRYDVAELTGNLRTADSILYSYKKKGFVRSIRRNLYTVISPETNQPAAHPFQIACAISEDAYLSHHSAFEFYGMSHQIWNEIYVSSSTKFNDFEFDGKHYMHIHSKTSHDVVTSGKVRVTSLERTVIDSIKDFSKIGGLEELLHCLSMVPFLNENKIIEILIIYNNQFLWQKTGLLLSCFPDLKLSSDFFELCKTNSQKSVRFLYESLKNEHSVFKKEWNLYIPEDLMRLLDDTSSYGTMENSPVTTNQEKRTSYDKLSH